MGSEPYIAIVDDEKDVREVIAANLRHCGYEIVEAESGRELSAMIAQQRIPSVIITDVIMPGKDGLEILMEVRKSYPDIKVVVISGGSRSRDMDLLHIAKNLGADIVLPKPIDLDYLEQVIGEIMVKDAV